MTMINEVVVYTDGASRGNPGPASYGVWICANEKPLEELKGYLGIQTNNYAEYSAVIQALTWAKQKGISQVVVRSDSELLVKQLSGIYKVKSDAIKPLYQQIKNLIGSSFKSVSFQHVRREFNKEADRLANEALDEL